MTTSRVTLLGGAALAAALGLIVAAQTGTVAKPTLAPPSRPAASAAPAPARARRAVAPTPEAAHDADPTLAAAADRASSTTYCATCHSERGKAGGLSLAHFDAMRAQEHPEVTEKMIRKLRAGMMPPAGARRPEPAVIAALATAFETRMDEPRRSIRIRARGRSSA